MKKIETLIENAKNDYIGLVIPNDLIDIAIKYFNDKDLTEYIDDLTEDEKRELVIDFSNEIDELDYGLVEWYKDHDYKLITLTKEDFEEVKSLTFDNRTLLITYNNSLYVNNKTNDIYFSDEEVEQLFKTISNPFSYIVIPAYGNSLERKPHISLY